MYNDSAVLFLHCVVLYLTKSRWPLVRLCLGVGGGLNLSPRSRSLPSTKPDPHPELDTSISYPSYQILENTLLAHVLFLCHILVISG